MIVAVSRFKVDAAQASRIEALFQSRPRRVDAYDGFLGLEVLRTVGHEPTFMLLTRWASRDALKRYMRSNDFLEVHQGGGDADAEFAICKVVTT